MRQQQVEMSGAPQSAPGTYTEELSCSGFSGIEKT